MYLQVLLGSLLPLLCHCSGADRAGEHAGERKDSESCGNDTGREEEDVAALIWGRRAAGTMGTESNVVSCLTDSWSACVPVRFIMWWLAIVSHMARPGPGLARVPRGKLGIRHIGTSTSR